VKETDMIIKLIRTNVENLLWIEISVEKYPTSRVPLENSGDRKM
jgi:hypothetical protein